MREILFRGKWLGNGEWVEGYYCKISETTYAFAEDYERNPIPVHYILQEVMTDWGLPNRFNQYEVDPETLCQYTELKDKTKNRGPKPPIFLMYALFKKNLFQSTPAEAGDIK